jgi:hypothetical protein
MYSLYSAWFVAACSGSILFSTVIGVKNGDRDWVQLTVHIACNRVDTGPIRVDIWTIRDVAVLTCYFTLTIHATYAIRASYYTNPFFVSIVSQLMLSTIT